MKNRIITTIATVLMLALACVSVYASSSSVEAEWYTGNAGSVNGKTNGQYHSLQSGSAYLSGSVNNATSTYPVVAKLYRAKSGIDQSYGSVSFKSSSYEKHKFPKSVTKSSKYYLIIGGGKHDTLHVFSGKLGN